MIVVVVVVAAAVAVVVVAAYGIELQVIGHYEGWNNWKMLAIPVWPMVEAVEADQHQIDHRDRMKMRNSKSNRAMTSDGCCHYCCFVAAAAVDEDGDDWQQWHDDDCQQG